MAEFAKGPWILDGHADDNGYFWIDGIRNGNTGAQVAWPSDPVESLVCTDESASLIAAAPELYEALREIMQNYAGQRWSIASVERGFAALAKARGEKCSR